jgi:hypothetical protein
MQRGSAPDLAGVTDRRLREIVAETLSIDPDRRPTAEALITLLTSDGSDPWPGQRRSADSPAPRARVGRLLRPSLGLAAVVLVLLAVLLIWASGLFSFVLHQLTPFEQGPAA